MNMTDEEPLKGKVDFWKADYQHRKTGNKYMKIGCARLQTDESLLDMDGVVVYVGKGGDMWARNIMEFDERFDKLPPNVQSDGRPEAFHVLRQAVRSAETQGHEFLEFRDAAHYKSLLEYIEQLEGKINEKG